ncbi:MAG TPA: Uma2 family endonuclease [Tepidisphaeraceae bacterium]
MTVIATKRLTADEFMSMRDSADFELIDGHLVERKLMGAHSSLIAAQMIRLIGNFVAEHSTGWVFDSEATYRCFGSADTLRRPDASFIRSGRLSGERVPETYIDIAPNLAAEVISPSNTADEIEAKVLEYLAAGVELVWVVYPHARTVHIRRADGSSDVASENQQLDGGKVLPGFACRVRDLFLPVPAPPPQQ